MLSINIQTNAIHGCKIFTSLIICAEYVAICPISFAISAYFFINYPAFALLLSYFFEIISPSFIQLFVIALNEKKKTQGIKHNL